ncbi:MAG: hypothetical protein JSV33_12755 [bacterium]|nr:MAG: hypothetical protein JSV33_12755 [bacterium]
MDETLLRFRDEIKLNNYSVELGADDERIVEAVRDWIDDGIAHHHAGGGEEGGRNGLAIELFSGSRPTDIKGPGRRRPTATFEDIEFYAGKNVTTLVIGGDSVVRVDLERGTARGFVSSAHLDSPWVISHRIFYLPLLELLRRRGAFYVHAGCVCRGDRCILICGGSGQGKSTLTYTLVRAGFSYLSDDAVFAQIRDEHLTIFSFPEKIKLDVKSRSHFPEFDPYRNEQEKVEIPLTETKIKNVAVSGKPYALVFTEIVDQARSELVPISQSEALLRLIRQSITMTNQEGIEKHLDVLTRLCAESRNFSLRFGKDIDNLPTLVRDTIFGEG